MLMILLGVYTGIQYIIGWILLRQLVRGLPRLLEGVGSVLLGICVSVPLTYICSCIFSFTKDPLLYGMFCFITVGFGIVVFRMLGRTGSMFSDIQQWRLKNVPFSEIALVLFSILFSTWLMVKTFRGGAGGQLFVGSNNVFDFGLFIGLVRSVAWGTNIPVISPFFPGTPFFYHFFFQFWVSLWEYAGIGTVLAVNIPSILSFSLLLIIIYYLPQIIFHSNRLTGWVAVLLTLSNATLTWWQILVQKGFSPTTFRSLWYLPTYPFAGPFDGSTISLFTTLNTYVNQRHLAIAMAIGLFIFILCSVTLEKKNISFFRVLILGGLTGMLLFWNIVLCMLTGLVIVMLCIQKKLWHGAVYFMIGAGSIILIFMLPFYQHIGNIVSFFLLGGNLQAAGSVIVKWTIWDYWWQNLSILPMTVLFGFIAIQKRIRIYAVPFIILFLLECLYANVGKHGFDQKFYSYLIIGINTLAAIGIVWLWSHKSYIFRWLSVGIFVLLMASGGIDLLVIKNEFAFPLVNAETAPVVSWIRFNTPKDAVFVSYSDIIDPVVLAGRKNYFGFFGNIIWINRSETVRKIYAGDIETAKRLELLYIMVPNWEKSDFPYSVNLTYLMEHTKLVYKDAKYSIFAL